MDGQLFDVEEPEPEPTGPLPARMRPRSVDDVVGQAHLLAPGTVLRRALDEGKPFSMILFGPPGSGKTTIARLFARAGDAAFEELSAVRVGKAEVVKVLEAARTRLKGGRRTILFLDEIHRFNKAQQDALLPAVEDGTITLIGATTENPYFEVNSALISRMQVFELQPLAAADVAVLLRRADVEGRAPDEVVEFLADRAGGDARTALSAFEIALEAGTVTLAVAEDALQRRAVRYDKGGDQHYDLISAWIKATRGSDPDASLYYLAVMLEGGEDPRFIARRMVVLASEDVGNADPRALEVAVAAAAAVEHVGMPECQFALAQCAIYLALTPKSNAAYKAIAAARAHVREHGVQTPPDYLRSAAYPAATKLGRGVGYDYPHDRPGHLSPQELLPDAVRGERFYRPDDAEARFAARAEELRRLRAQAAGDDLPPRPEPPPLR